MPVHRDDLGDALPAGRLAGPVRLGRAARRTAAPGGARNPLGMRGTRSIGLHLAGEVPAHQVVGERGRYRTVAVESMIPAAHLAWTACWLGAARAALADVVALLRSPKRPRSINLDS